MSFQLARLNLPPKQMPDAAISQADPVSTTLYEVLPTTPNVEMISVMGSITWATTQPTPLVVVVTVDGKTAVYSMVNPVSGSAYHIECLEYNTDAGQPLVGWAARSDVAMIQALKQCSGRSVRIQARITWATTQPTPLVIRVKYAQY